MAQKAVLQGVPPRVNSTFKGHTVYEQSYNFMYIDESHELRTGASIHRAVYALSSLAMVKVLGSATPLIEGLSVRCLFAVAKHCIYLSPPGYSSAGPDHPSPRPHLRRRRYSGHSACARAENQEQECCGQGRRP